MLGRLGGDALDQSLLLALVLALEFDEARPRPLATARVAAEVGGVGGNDP